MKYLFTLILIALAVSCGKVDSLDFESEQTLAPQQVITAGRNLLLDGKIELQDIRVGDKLRLEIESWQTVPIFRNEHRFLLPEHRDDMGCWASYRYFDSFQQKKLLPSDVLKQLRIVVNGEAKPLIPLVQEVKWSDGSMLYDLIISEEISEKGEVELEFHPDQKQQVERVGFVALTSPCKEYLYRDLQLNPSNFNYVDQRFNLETELKISYQLIRP